MFLTGLQIATAQNKTAEGLPIEPSPEGIDNPPGLADRRQAQMATVSEFKSFVGFGFSDRRKESGISFKHRIVADAGKEYKMVHYDHGNGVSVADIDGDGLYDIYFTTQVGANELWRNLGDGRFNNVTVSAGVAIADRISVASSFADIDNDGDPDLYVTTVRKGNLLFENDGTGHFKDISGSSGLDYEGHSSGAVFFDFNRDGLLDLYLTNVGQYTTDLLSTNTYQGVEYSYYVGFKDAFSGHLFPSRTEKSLLFENQGNNRFKDVTDIMLFVESGWSGDAHIIDVNEDGWPDIYEINMQGHDKYYENIQGQSFLQKSRAIFPKTSWGAMGIAVFDWNNDGRMDIYITDMHSDMSKKVGPDLEKKKSDMGWTAEHLQQDGNEIFGNSFFEKQEDGTFLEISDRIGAENYWPWGLSVGDLNADGYRDVFIASSMNYPYEYHVNSLLINDQGKQFRNAEFILGAEPRRDHASMTPWFGLDCAGSDKQRKRECIGHDGKIMVYSSLGSRSSVIFDYDNDGDLDIITNEFNSNPMVLTSNLSDVSNTLSFLKIHLTGSSSNRGGIGARVIVRAGDKKYTQTMDGKSGYLSQSLMPLYFGLDGAGRADSIEVNWPSGLTQTIETDIPENGLLEITEPAD